MFLHSWHPHQLLTTIAGIDLHWYGLGLALAAFVSIALVERLGKSYRLDVNRLFDVSLATIVGGFIGARMYHIVNEWPFYATQPLEMLQVWHGGLALHGGILLGGLTMLALCRQWKWNAWLIADIFAPAIAIGQAIGRWGNYFNQELYGRPTNLPWGIPIDVAHRPAEYFTSNYFHPTFLYESIGLLLIGAVLLTMHQHQIRTPENQRRVGVITLTYLGLAAILRGATEFLRIDRTPIIGGVRLPILVSGLILVAVVVILLIRYRRTHANRT